MKTLIRLTGYARKLSAWLQHEGNSYWKLDCGGATARRWTPRQPVTVYTFGSGCRVEAETLSQWGQGLALCLHNTCSTCSLSETIPT